MKKVTSAFILVCFLVNAFGPIPIVYAEPIYSVEGQFHLPAPGILVHLSPAYNPPILKGIKVHPENPFKFEFILDQGDDYDRHPERSEGSQKEQPSWLAEGDFNNYFSHYFFIKIIRYYMSISYNTSFYLLNLLFL